MVAGQYFFCDPDAPLFPYPHYLGSAYWHRGDGTPWPEYGEIENTTRPFDKGQLPLPLPDAVFFGQDGCIGQEIPSHTIPAPTTLLWGVDVRCWQGRVPLEMAAGGVVLGGKTRQLHEFTWGGLTFGGTAADFIPPAGEQARGGVVLGGKSLERKEAAQGGFSRPTREVFGQGGLEMGGIETDAFGPATVGAGGLKVGGTETDSGPAAFDYGVDFRDTAGYVTDPAGDTYCLAESYPTTRGGITFGWESGGPSSRDRSTSVDPRLAGINFVPTGSGGVFRVDIPAGAGLFDITIAAGDATSSNNTNWEIRDGTSPLFVVTGNGTSGGTFQDATDTNYSAAAWPGSETPVTVVFASGIFRIVENGSSGSSNNVIAHIRIRKH